MPLCLKVYRHLGQHALVKLRQHALLDSAFGVQRLGEYLLIPLSRQPSEEEVRSLTASGLDVQLTVIEVPRVAARPTLLNTLGARLPPYLLSIVPRAIDVVGDIAVVEVAPQLWDYRKVVGEAILTVNPRISTVLAKRGAVEGVYRVRGWEVIAGVVKTETVHREYGCVFYVDLSKTYFSPRLGFEHHRVASQVGEFETVVDLFTGVGPFAIHIAKRLHTGRVYAIDINPSAIAYLEKNIVANRVAGRVVPIQGDAREVVKERLLGVAHRVVMNLPLEAFKFLDAACSALRKEGGIIHYYAFTTETSPIETVGERVARAIEDAGRRLKEVSGSRVVKATAPHECQIVMDVKVV